MRGNGPLTRSAGNRDARTSGAQGRTDIPPQINVLASMIVLVSICLMGIGALFGARRQRRFG